MGSRFIEIQRRGIIELLHARNLADGLPGVRLALFPLRSLQRPGMDRWNESGRADKFWRDLLGRQQGRQANRQYETAQRHGYSAEPTSPPADRGGIRCRISFSRVKD